MECENMRHSEKTVFFFRQKSAGKVKFSSHEHDPRNGKKKNEKKTESPYQKKKPQALRAPQALSASAAGAAAGEVRAPQARAARPKAEQAIDR